MKEIHNHPVKDPARVEAFKGRMQMIRDLVDRSNKEKTFRFTESGVESHIRAELFDKEIEPMLY